MYIVCVKKVYCVGSLHDSSFAQPKQVKSQWDQIRAFSLYTLYSACSSPSQRLSARWISGKLLEPGLGKNGWWVLWEWDRTPADWRQRVSSSCNRQCSALHVVNKQKDMKINHGFIFIQSCYTWEKSTIMVLIKQKNDRKRLVQIWEKSDEL